MLKVDEPLATLNDLWAGKPHEEMVVEYSQMR
ncbi:hypothetical protein NKDENANG_00525 [Candidatus Entotheonellaceae bacterium PAL068K]